MITMIASRREMPRVIEHQVDTMSSLSAVRSCRSIRRARGQPERGYGSIGLDGHILFRTSDRMSQVLLESVSKLNG
jgi:hypothetical protein